MTATKTEKFAWNETNTATAVEMYKKIIASDGLEVANSQGLIDIAKAVSMLMSEDSYWITGQTIQVDGGEGIINIFG